MEIKGTIHHFEEDDLFRSIFVEKERICLLPDYAWNWDSMTGTLDQLLFLRGNLAYSFSSLYNSEAYDNRAFESLALKIGNNVKDGNLEVTAIATAIRLQKSSKTFERVQEFIQKINDLNGQISQMDDLIQQERESLNE